jgi:hypothetical protein
MTQNATAGPEEAGLPPGGGPAPEPVPGDRLRSWLLRDIATSDPPPRQPWWRVMCLTGLNYFSTLGYQPGIAALAAGLVSPLATLLLVALTLLGALPVYRRVARESPDGQGAIAMLERLLPRWSGKALVLVLLGFVVTDFIMTITLSTADATAHILQNPYAQPVVQGHRTLVTLALLTLLAVVFLRGFAQALGVAVALVGIYLTLNTIVVLVSLAHIANDLELVFNWRAALTIQYQDVFAVALVAALAVPKLTLGLSGVETGVAAMPLIQNDPGIQDDPDDGEPTPAGRIRGTHRLLTTAALIMSVFLITTSVATTLLIPRAGLAPGGAANGRALAYLAYAYLGSGIGTVYDLSTVLILWFAAASALAALLKLVPRYLPRYGLAPDWIRAKRPLVLVFFSIAVVITLIFGAGVDAQGGAYATAVLALITAAAFAVSLSAWRHGHRYATLGYGAITAVLAYATVATILERRDGLKIACVFIVTIIVLSVASRAHRATELRASEIQLDAPAELFVSAAAAAGAVNLIASEPDDRDGMEYHDKVSAQREDNHLPSDEPFMFLEVTVTDQSDFSSQLRVYGEERAGYRVLRLEAPTAANAIAAVLLHIRDTSGRLPNIYFTWTEGNPVLYLLRYLFLGDGEIAPLTRELLRQAEKDRSRRPLVHVG